MRVAGPDFSLVGSYGSRSLPAATTYTLNAGGTSFMGGSAAEALNEADQAAALTQVAPFSVYVDAPAETGRAFDVNLDLDGNIGVGVGQMDEDGSIRIVRDGNGLTIYSPAGCDMEVYAVDGRLVEVLRLAEGANRVDTLARGVYVINGEKVVF